MSTDTEASQPSISVEYTTNDGATVVITGTSGADVARQLNDLMGPSSPFARAAREAPTRTPDDDATDAAEGTDPPKPDQGTQQTAGSDAQSPSKGKSKPRKTYLLNETTLETWAGDSDELEQRVADGENVRSISKKKHDDLLREQERQRQAREAESDDDDHGSDEDSDEDSDEGSDDTGRPDASLEDLHMLGQQLVELVGMGRARETLQSHLGVGKLKAVPDTDMNHARSVLENAIAEASDE